MPAEKTNVMRLLEQQKLPYTPHQYPHSDGVAVDGGAVAALLGQDPRRVFKTLVTCGSSGAHFVFAIPVLAALNLKKAARAVGEKSIALIPVKDLTPLTGYVRGGCSPVGMRKRFPTVFDKTARGLETIIVSAGRIGYQVELSPEGLRSLLGAAFADVTETP